MSGFSMPLALFLSVLMIAVFSFTAVASWAESRRKERQAYYRTELLKKIAESPGESQVLEMLREEQRIGIRKRREEMKLGGLVTVATGMGLGVFLGAIQPREPVYLVGLIPGLVGVALLFHVYTSFPRQ